MLKRLCCMAVMVILTLSAQPNTLEAKIGSCPIEDLLQQADYAAIIRIESGKALGRGGRYKGRVLDDIKGVSKDEVLEFICWHNLEVGTRYLVFVARLGRRLDSSVSSDLRLEQEGAQIEKEFDAARQGNGVIRTGDGAMKVYEQVLGLTEQVHVSPLVRVPPSIRTTHLAKGSKKDLSSYDVLVSLKDLVSCLKSTKR
jgi:hypothetical protein